MRPHRPPSKRRGVVCGGRLSGSGGGPVSGAAGFRSNFTFTIFTLFAMGGWCWLTEPIWCCFVGRAIGGSIKVRSSRLGRTGLRKPGGDQTCSAVCYRTEY